VERGGQELEERTANGRENGASTPIIQSAVLIFRRKHPQYLRLLETLQGAKDKENANLYSNKSKRHFSEKKESTSEEADSCKATLHPPRRRKTLIRNWPMRLADHPLCQRKKNKKRRPFRGRARGRSRESSPCFTRIKRGRTIPRTLLSRREREIQTDRHRKGELRD